MNLTTMKIMIRTEVRLRMRRLSTLVTLLAIVAMAWMMFVDQTSGSAFIVVENARVSYTSSTLAMGSVALFGLVFGLAGFFLVRGRISEDVRCGTSAVIGASPVSNGLFLLCRWLGGVGYLIVLAGVFMLTIMVCHLFRGEGPIQPGIYLETYAVILLPLICFSVSCAVLFDSVAPLMGKLGDVIFFILWVAQFTVVGSIDRESVNPLSAVFLLDFSGILMIFQSLHIHLHTSAIAIGSSPFDAAVPALSLGNDLWSPPMVLVRAGSAALASVIALPAVFLFHRYSSDKVRLRHTSSRRSPITILNQLLRPFAGLVQPLYLLAARLPGMAGQIAADVALTFSSAPAVIPGLILIWVASMFAAQSALPAILLAATAVWGILISDLSTRDYANACEELGGVVSGGIVRRYVRQSAAAMVLGFLFTGLIAVRLAVSHPIDACAILTGLLSLSALSSLMGRTSRTARLFLSLFLFWIYVATQVRGEAMLDVIGFNGSADVTSTLMQLSVAIIASISGYLYNRRGR